MKLKHKHAELMMEYAKDAMETAEPWLRWEVYSIIDNDWRPFTFYHPFWFSETQYRRKPQTININGHEVPKPYRGEMQYGQSYYVTELETSELCTQLSWNEDLWDQSAMERGIIHLTKEAAIKHAEALLSFTELSPTPK